MISLIFTKYDYHLCQVRLSRKCLRKVTKLQERLNVGVTEMIVHRRSTNDHEREMFIVRLSRQTICTLYYFAFNVRFWHFSNVLTFIRLLETVCFSFRKTAIIFHPESIQSNLRIPSPSKAYFIVIVTSIPKFLFTFMVVHQT